MFGPARRTRQAHARGMEGVMSERHRKVLVGMMCERTREWTDRYKKSQNPFSRWVCWYWAERLRRSDAGLAVFAREGA